mmetsp:Transcript_61617/g.101825  ORF Transcript_61617/g.101825 Transcript_61617/m.101825 type:complete len:208 (-) Transcript_61617:62-685(-)
MKVCRTRFIGHSVWTSSCTAGCGVAARAMDRGALEVKGRRAAAARERCCPAALEEGKLAKGTVTVRRGVYCRWRKSWSSHGTATRVAAMPRSVKGNTLSEAAATDCGAVAADCEAWTSDCVGPAATVGDRTALPCGPRGTALVKAGRVWTTGWVASSCEACGAGPVACKADTHVYTMRAPTDTNATDWPRGPARLVAGPRGAGGVSP